MNGLLLPALTSILASVGVERIGWLLVHSLWQFFLLSAIGLLLSQGLRRNSAAVRYWTLVGLLPLLVLTPMVTWFTLRSEPSSLSGRSGGVAQRALDPVDTVAEADSLGPLTDGGDVPSSHRSSRTEVGESGVVTGDRLAGSGPALKLTATESWARAVEVLRPWLSTLVALWSLGVCAFALRPALGWYTVRRLRKCGITAVEESVRQALLKLKKTLRVRRSVEVFQSTLVDMPVVVGCFRCVILLPVSVVGGLHWAQLEAILAHELAHVRRYDYLINLIQTVAETIFFYHPAVWWLSHRIRVERENCCDDIAVAALGDRLQYGRALLALEEQRRGVTVLALSARGGSLLSRIQRLSGAPTMYAMPRTGGLAALGSAVAILAGLLWVVTTGFADSGNSIEADFGPESHGLRCRLMALAPDVSDDSSQFQRTVTRFSRSADMTFGVELKNVSSHTLTLMGVRYGAGYAEAVRGSLNTKMLAPHLFDFEFTDTGGNRIPRTQREYFDSWVVLMNASTHELKPGQSLIVVLRPAKFNVPMDYDLAPGDYEVKVRYRGPDDAFREKVREHGPGKALLSAWPHEIVSDPVKFAIEQPSRRAKQEDLRWGRPVEGLRAAIEYRLPDDVAGNPMIAPGVPLGTSIGVVFHVQNVSDEPITFVSETARQGDDVRVTDAQGKAVEVKSVWLTGWPIDVAWKLAPGDVAQLHVLAPAINSLTQPGQYTIRYTIRFNSRLLKDGAGNVLFPRPGDYDQELDTADTPLHLHAVGSPVDQAQTPAPFRLRDHWIVEDVRFAEDGKEIVTVSVQGGVNVRRWDVADRRLISEIKLAGDKHGRRIRQDTLQLSADGRKVLAATDQYVGIWDATTGDLIKKLNYPTKQWDYDCVRCLDCSRDLSVVIAGLGTSYEKTTEVYNGYGIVWNARSGEIQRLVTDANGFYFRDIAMSEDGTRFATCNEHGGGVSIWETSSGKKLRDFSEDISTWHSPDPELIENNIVYAVAFSPDGKLLAISGTFGVKLFDSQSGTLQRTIDAPYRFQSGSTGIVFSADGSRLARWGASRGGKEYTVPIWSTATGEKQYELLTDANAVSFSSDGAIIAVGSSDFCEALSVWPVSGQTVKSLSPPVPYARVDRVEENTHYRGKIAKELAGEWKPAWGSAQHGIQYGIALTIPKNQFRVGERVLMAAFLRNDSDKPLQIDLRPDMFGNLPQVYDAAGKLITLDKRPLLGDISHYRETLQPGECFGPLYLNFGLGDNPRSGRQFWTPYWPNPKIGTYKVTHTVPFQVTSPDVSGVASDPQWTDGKLTSGTLEFEVMSGVPDGS